jgi:hypothetical protein
MAPFYLPYFLNIYNFMICKLNFIKFFKNDR